MEANQIKYLLKITLFSIGVLLFTLCGAVIVSEIHGIAGTKLQDISIGQFFVILLFLVGVYITTTLLKNRTVTKWETDREKEIQKKNRNNGN
jgi:hypothetical protein